MQVCNTSDADRSLAEANRFFALLKKVTLGFARVANNLGISMPNKFCMEQKT